MKNLIKIVLVVALAGIVRPVEAAGPLPRSTPEAQGVSSASVLEFVNTLDPIDAMHGLMVVRHGQVIAEGWWAPYDAGHQHVLYSLSKSFTSSAVGFAVAEGKLSIDDLVLKFFPEDAPANPSDNLKAMRVRDLLMMSTGHQDEPPTGPDEISAKSFLAQPVPHLPGTHFKYNTAATFMLSAIVQKTTGQTVLEYLRPRLFEPLGIERPVWDTNFQGISLGGYGLRVHTEDLAKFGQLYLQKGNWQGRQLLPAAWVTMATTRQTSNGSNPDRDWNQGYGFQFWRCRHDAFRGDGAFGQFCVVMPDKDAVVVINSGVKDMQAVLNAIWDKLLPGLQAQALPPNPEEAQALANKLAHLEITPAQGATTPAAATQALNRKFVFPTNDAGLESLTLTNPDSGKSLVLNVRLSGQDVIIPCGYHEWKNSRAPLRAGKLARFPDEPVAGTFAWPADDICAVKLCAYETPYHKMLTLKFAGDQMTLDSELNVAFGPTREPALTGRTE
ncbi:MAG: serine hydrolase [Verrucomicrobiota bacterium]|jgi:CubicO group peptidase (beta-lactamase class C family)